MAKAIVLAGSLNNGQLRECSTASSEALIKIGDKIMLEYVLEALKNAQGVEDIIVAGPKKQLESFIQEDQELSIVEKGTTIMESLINAVDVLKGDDFSRILIVTADIPLITGAIIDRFLEECQEEEGDIIYPIVPKSFNEAKFPHMKRTYVKLKEGIFTGGNIFLVNPQIIKPLAQKAGELIELRKSPLKLVNYIGFTYFLKYIFHNLSAKDAEDRIAELFNIQGKALSFSFPEIGVDVDKPSDLELVEKILTSFAGQ